MGHSRRLGTLARVDGQRFERRAARAGSALGRNAGAGESAQLKPAVWEVTEVKAGRSFTWVTRHSGLLITGLHQLEPIEGGTLATLAVRFSGLLGPLVGWLTRRLNHRYLAFEADGLRKRSTQ